MQKRPRLHLSLALLALVAVPTTSAEKATFPGVQKLMSEQEYSAAGLDKLSPEEVKSLNQWLIRYTAGEAQVLITTDEEVKEASKEVEILSSIVPPFKGWTGSNVFKLENGQVWKQRRRGTLFYDGDDTRVSISRNFMGFYKMTHLATGKSVQVSSAD